MKTYSIQFSRYNPDTHRYERHLYQQVEEKHLKHVLKEVNGSVLSVEREPEQEKHCFSGHMVFLNPLNGKYTVSWKGTKEGDFESLDEVKAYIKRINTVTTKKQGRGFKSLLVPYPRAILGMII